MAYLLLVALLYAGSHHSDALTVQHRGNPVRKVVNLLRNMQVKVTKEGEEKEKLYDKYMCYCKNSDGDLTEAIATAEAKIPQLESAIKEESAEKDQLNYELENHKNDRAAAKEALAKAEAMREKEAAAYASLSEEDRANILALGKAIPAIEKGIGGSFLQTAGAAQLRKLSVSVDMNAGERDLLVSFLSSSNGYVPQSQEILGILKQLKDEMEASLAEAISTEEAAIRDYEDLVAAKTKQINALTKAIEEKTSRVGELAVRIAETSNDLEDTEEALEQDKKFLADLEKNCNLKKSTFEEYQKTMAMELKALADTIKLLNDDDALDLFKKTLPSGASSFIQIQETSQEVQLRALAFLQTSHKHKDPRMDLLEIALHGGKLGFDKIIADIDNLVAVLEREQKDDDKKKDYCALEFDKSDDTKKELEISVSDLQKAIDDGKETVATLQSEIAALTDSLKTLDDEVEQQTEQRKEENTQYVETLAANNAAKDLLGLAKNRLAKFYNPKMYQAEPKRELSEEFVQTSSHKQAPEADLSYSKSTEENAGVTAMIDMLVKDLDTQITEMKMEEKYAQADYEKFMADAQEKRRNDAKALSDKKGTSAEVAEEVGENEEMLRGKNNELMMTQKYIAGLHAECDWLLKYFDTRKAARADEISALKKAKYVLNGADYS